mmetsp:Transcript_74457/g.131570  ORF Transcript_74457/g.131570 Transcript_74457/m.131570 type:complete len:83 (-) Transcript_74457:352-600(-)
MLWVLTIPGPLGVLGGLCWGYRYSFKGRNEYPASLATLPILSPLPSPPSCQTRTIDNNTVYNSEDTLPIHPPVICPSVPFPT